MKAVKDNYGERKEEIAERLAEFRALRSADNDRLFEEMCFCVLTANASARMGMNTIEKIRGVLRSASQEELAALMKGIYRFPNKRSEYIVHNREFLEGEHGFDIRGLLDSFDSVYDLRKYIVKNIKGLGYKEASHFLRNIGFSGLCILDKHVLSALAEAGVVDEPVPPRNAGEYLDVERRMIGFCNESGIGVDEMDLAIWSLKTGEVLK